MKIHETVVSIDPVLIFQRICFLKHSVEDLIRFFSYELAPFPMLIFDSMWLRKTAKSALFAIFKEQKYEDFDRTNSTIVIDGGMLLHRFLWPRGNTFDSIASAYATFVQKSWGNRVHVVFDGYSVMSTKGSEQDRRKQKKGCIDYEFTPSMVPQISQDTFLTSSKNKTQLIACYVNISIGMIFHGRDVRAMLIPRLLEPPFKSLSKVIRLLLFVKILMSWLFLQL